MTTLPSSEQDAFAQRLIGGMMRDPHIAEEAASSLDASDLRHPLHQILFGAIKTRLLDGGSLDRSLITADLVAAEWVDPDSGAPLDANAADLVIASAWANATTATAAGEHIARIRGWSGQRRIAEMGRELVQESADSGGDPEAVAEAILRVDQKIQALTEAIGGSPWDTLAEAARDVQSGKVTQPSIRSGLPDLDAKLDGGFRPGELCIIAGRPGMGKSTLGMDIARHASLHEGIPGLFVSLEMSLGQLALRVLAAEARVGMSDLKRGLVAENEVPLIEDVIERLGPDSALKVWASTTGSYADIAAVVTSAVRRVGIRYLVVDYLQLLSSTGESGRREQSRQEIVGAISRELKRVALRFGLVVFAVAQLNRGPEQRADKKPQMADLRESGALEQDADYVIVVDRPEQRDPTDRPGEADLHGLKNRSGAEFVATVVFEGPYSQFAPGRPQDAGFGGHAAPPPFEQPQSAPVVQGVVVYPPAPPVGGEVDSMLNWADPTPGT